MPTVALGSDFLDAYARIPRAQQKKVREFTEKFKANPKSPGFNYEKIYDVRHSVAQGLTSIRRKSFSVHLPLIRPGKAAATLVLPS